MRRKRRWPNGADSDNRPQARRLAACPFCKAKVRKPRTVEGVYGQGDCKGGRCECGAAYVLDATGKQGGECLLDVLALICDGDTEEALTLQKGKDYRLAVIRYEPSTGFQFRAGARFVEPKLWFAQRRAREQ